MRLTPYVDYVNLSFDDRNEILVKRWRIKWEETN